MLRANLRSEIRGQNRVATAVRNKSQAADLLDATLLVLGFGFLSELGFDAPDFGKKWSS